MRQRLQLLILMLTLSVTSYGQYTFDGNEGCAEYDNAFVPSTQPSGGSSTCNVSGIYGAIYESGTSDFIQIGIEHGNGGQSNFRIYLNTDCDSSTGQILAAETDGDVPIVDVGGADYMLNFSTGNNNDATVYQWNGVDMELYTGADIESLLGTNCEGSSSFAEVRFPVKNSGLFDVCDTSPTPCGSIEITAILSNAGNTLNSRFCDNVSLTVDVPVNTPPTADFVSEQTCYDEFTKVGIFLEPSTNVDPNLGDFPGNNDIINYTWSSSPLCEGCFTNESGQAASVDEIATMFAPTVAGDYDVTLTLVDSYGCSVDSSVFTSTVSVSEKVANQDSGDCIGTVTVLPVSLLDSNVSVEGNDIVYTWTTLSEVNNQGFYVEKSQDGFDYETLGWLDGADSSNEIKNYEFVDNNPSNGYNYYKLVQVDFDGTATAIASEVVEYLVDETYAVFPSPATSFVKVKGGEQFTVYNLMGKLIDRINNQKNIYNLDITNYTSGTYVVRFDNGKTFKFVKP